MAASTALISDITSRLENHPSDELLAIWCENDRTEWSDECFAAIQSILTKRGIVLPPQNAAANEDSNTPEFTPIEQSMIETVLGIAKRLFVSREQYVKPFQFWIC